MTDSKLEFLTSQYHRMRSCKNKRQYKNRKLARSAAKAMRAKLNDNFIEVYSCKYHKHYHVGHGTKRK